MPWTTTDPMTERAKFILAYTEGCYTMTELCRRFGISRKTGYKWRRRYEAGGVAALQDRSRAPATCPHRTPTSIADQIVAVRTAHPLWGPKKILAYLHRRHPETRWPSASTGHRILTDAGLVETRRKRRPVRHPGSSPIDADRPGAVWTADFKGEFRLGSGAYCYPLTVQDAYSRYLLACVALPSTARSGVEPVFAALFRRHGCPAVIRTDNGSPFAYSQALGGLSRLSAGWIARGIGHDRIEPGCPQQNGRHERMHRTLKKHTTRPPEARPEAQQARFDRFRDEFNHVRPHQALDGDVPADWFRPASAADASAPDMVAGPVPNTAPKTATYPGHFEVRKVGASGSVKLFNRELFISQVLQGRYVGFEEIEEGVWSLFFHDLLLARLHEPTWTLHPGHP